MEKPNLNRTWETFIKIPSEENMPYSILLRNVCNTIRFKIYQMVSDLKSKNMLKWYCFLLHPSRRKGDTNSYFHIRFELKEGIDDKERVNAILPDYCEKDMTANFMDIEENPREIGGIDNPLLKNEEIEEAWRILGEQSEWFRNMLNIHKENVDITAKQIGQFLHFYFNMSQLLFMCPCCGNIFHGAKIIVFS
jgi:hypothetical protein